MVAAEAVRTVGALALTRCADRRTDRQSGLFTDESYEYCNLPDHPAFDWYSARIAEQQSVLDELEPGYRWAAAGSGGASGR